MGPIMSVERDEREKVIDRVRKLLAMSTSTNDNEAAAFHARARAMLREHHISPDDVFGSAHGLTEHARRTRPRAAPRPSRERAKFSGRFTAAWVTNTKPQPKEIQYTERLKKGLSLLLYVSPHGRKTWRVLFYQRGKPRGERLGVYPALSIANAKVAAYKFDPEAAIAAKEAGTFKEVALDWIVDHVDGQKLRTKEEIERRLERYVYPKWENEPIFDIDRNHVSELLRTVANKHGRPQADAVYSTIRSIMSWYRANGPKAYDDKYPIVPGLKPDKRKTKAKRRTRVLFDDEIRAVWAACDEVDKVFGGLVKMLLLTGQRLRKVAGMRWDDIADGVWTIPVVENEKGTARVIKFSDMARALLAAMPRVDGNDYVFPASRGDKKHFNSFSQRKEELDRELRKRLTDMPPWVLHDLRRTAKTRMSKIKIDRLHSELALGHTLEGVEGIYDQYDYVDEIAAALQKLADHIALVLNPPEGTNVVPLQGGARR
jgi:integrase